MGTSARRIVAWAAIAALSTMAWVTAGAEAATTTQRVSQPASGDADGVSLLGDVTPDGRRVVFKSYAANLVPGDTNAGADVFMMDRRSGVLQRVSVGEGAVQAQYAARPPGTFGEGSGGPSISDDGTRVAFHSEALNFATGANTSTNVFVRDLVAGTTQLLSAPRAGAAPASCSSDSPRISGNGRYVAFKSDCNNLVAGDSNGVVDVFVKDLQTGAIDRVSVNSGETQGNGNSQAAAISDDGAVVAFSSAASNLWPNDTNGRSDVFMRDRAAGTTIIVSYTSANRMSTGSATAPAVSADGKRVAFASDGSDMVPGDTNASTDVFVRDMAAGTIQRVSVAAGGTQLALGGVVTAISAAGTKVSFETLSPDAVADDTNATWDVFVHDMVAGTTTRASVGAGGEQGDGASQVGVLSGDGTTVAFESSATNLVASDENAQRDVFVRGVPAPPLPPRPVITFPAPGGVVRDTAVPVRGTASPATTVRVLEGSAILGQATTASDGTFALTATLTEGAHTITAISNDGADGSASSPVSFTVDLSPVAPVIVSPAQGSAVKTAAVPVTGSSAPGASVSLSHADDASALGSGTADETGAWTITVTLAEGTQAVNATAIDKQGRTTSTPTPRTFTVDLTAPEAPEITSPANGATVTATGATIQGTAEPGARVTILEGSVPFANPLAAGDGTWTTTVAFGNGSHTIRARATDAAGNAGALSAAVTFTMNADRVAPVLTITTANNSAFLPNAVLIEGTATDAASGITNVIVTYVNAATGTTVALNRQATCTCPGSSVTWSDAPALTPGYYRVTAVAFDAAGNRSRSVSVSFLAL